MPASERKPRYRRICHGKGIIKAPLLADGQEGPTTRSLAVSMGMRTLYALAFLLATPMLAEKSTRPIGSRP